jgi:hypothetical protein
MRMKALWFSLTACAFLVCGEPCLSADLSSDPSYAYFQEFLKQTHRETLSPEETAKLYGEFLGWQKQKEENTKLFSEFGHYVKRQKQDREVPRRTGLSGSSSPRQTQKHGQHRQHRPAAKRASAKRSVVVHPAHH